MELILRGKAPLIRGIEEEQAIIGIWADPGGSTPCNDFPSQARLFAGPKIFI
jgi:hypothetical protein